MPDEDDVDDVIDLRSYVVRKDKTEYIYIIKGSSTLLDSVLNELTKSRKRARAPGKTEKIVG